MQRKLQEKNRNVDVGQSVWWSEFNDAGNLCMNDVTLFSLA